MTYSPVRSGGIQTVGFNYETDAYVPPAPYQTYPMTSVGLGQLAPPTPLPSGGFSLARINMRQVLLVAMVVIVVALVMYQLLKLTKRTTMKVERNTVLSRVSTKELTRRLYERLDSKGRNRNTQTMRALERLAR